jgi:hypothetical protein
LVLPAQAKYSGGSGTAQDPYQIATAAELILLGETPADYGKHFLLTTDIDLDPRLPGRKAFDKAVIAPDTYPGDTSYGLPVFTGPAFAGVLDGNGHTVSHLTISGREYLGLFGQLANKAQVMNLGLVSVNVACSSDDVGGLVGWNGGTVTRCYSTGAVSGTSGVGGLVGNSKGRVIQCYSTCTVSGSDYVGGLVGHNHYDGTVAQCYSTGAVSGTATVGGLVGQNYGDVTRCYSTGVVSSTKGAVGGLVGYNYYEGVVTQCFSTGAVSGAFYVGGLVGVNSKGRVIQCYSSGTVTGDYYVGGLVGYNEYGIVTQCYSTGAVTGSEGVGGLIGYGFVRDVTACFWDTQTSGQTWSHAGTGKTTAQMHDPNMFRAAGWDDFVGPADGPDDIWAEPEGGGYPILWWQVSPLPTLPGFSGGTGEPNAPYGIARPEELNSIGHNPRLMRCHFKVIADLDLAGLHFYPIGDYDYPYGGVFDGNGHTVSHPAIKGESYAGLFGVLGSDAEVKDLGVVDVNITGSSSFAGGLVGGNNGRVTQCYSTGAVSSTGQYSPVGGLVGDNCGTVTGCYSTGTVSGTGAVGGLVGYNDGGALTDCYSTGVVSGTSGVGGLVGYNDYGIVTQCYSTDTVTGTFSEVGGLVGYSEYGIVTDCYSTGVVSGTSGVGGLVGYNYYEGVVTQCFSTSVVSGTSGVGGLVGCNDRSTVTQCYSTGAVSGKDFVAGLVGSNYGGVTQCYSSGMVSGSSGVGGLVGHNLWGTITASFWDTQTSGQAKSAGGTGKTTAEMQKAKTFLDAGWDFVGETKNGTADIWWILEGKGYPRLWWELPAKK